MLVLFICLIYVCNGKCCVSKQSEDNYLIDDNEDKCENIDGVYYGKYNDLNEDYILLYGIGGNLIIDNVPINIEIGLDQMTHFNYIFLLNHQLMNCFQSYAICGKKPLVIVMPF